MSDRGLGKVDYRHATFDDLDLLVQMNRQLVEDEGHRHRSKPREWFRERMRNLLEGGYRAVLFEIDGEVVAYALFVEQDDTRSTCGSCSSAATGAGRVLDAGQ